MTRQIQTFGDVAHLRPDLSRTDGLDPAFAGPLSDLFDTWDAVRGRNRVLTTYYTMHNKLRDLGISVPRSFAEKGLNCAVGWCAKAVKAHSMRSVFDGYVMADGRTDPGVDELVRRNRMRSMYQRACAASLVHGVSAVTCMRGAGAQPACVLRSYTANQFAALWDKDAGRPACGVFLADVDRATGLPSRYVAHFPDAVLDLRADGAGRWSCSEEPNGYGEPLFEVFVNDPDDDRPLGHSLLTEELLGIVDKAMRDVLRMEIGAEFFTFPQRYILGAAEDMFSVPDPEGAADADGNPDMVPSPAAKWRAYVGSLLAITRDENGEVPQVGQFSPTSAENFTMTFENDAQRFSGATNVPLAQLGVLSNTYTSSDALGAANDPLILEVETMNRRNAEALESLGRMMAAISRGVAPGELEARYRGMQARMTDPSMPTVAARADAVTKVAGVDKSLPGTRTMYEDLGWPQAKIDRHMAEVSEASAIEELDAIRRAALGAQEAAQAPAAPQPEAGPTAPQGAPGGA